MTPIVLTENGEEEKSTAATPPPPEASVTGGVMVTAHPNSPSKDGESGESPPLAALPTAAEDNAGAKDPSTVDGGGPAATDAHASKPVAERRAAGEREYRLGASAEVVAPLANARTPFPAPNKISTDKVAAAGKSLPLPAVSMTKHGGASMTLSASQAAAGAATVPVAKTEAGQSNSLAAGAMLVANSGQPVSRAVVKPTEQLFMEDTQLYLGCAVCGVKYLVEAVEPEPPKATQGESRGSFASGPCRALYCAVCTVRLVGVVCQGVDSVNMAQKPPFVRSMPRCPGDRCGSAAGFRFQCPKRVVTWHFTTIGPIKGRNTFVFHVRPPINVAV